MHKFDRSSETIFILCGMLIFNTAFLIWSNSNNFSPKDRAEPNVFTGVSPSISNNDTYKNETQPESVEKTNPTIEPVKDETPIKIPEPKDRVPGTKLSQKILDDLNIEDPIEEEGIFYALLTPDDSIYPQWYTNSISAPQAWDVTTGSSDVVVAVIDTGYALDHEDLNSAWYVNDGEQGMTQLGEICWSGSPQDKQTNDCDDDNNGYVDDWRGWDFANSDNNPQAGENYAAGATHGTKSAGLIGARGNNGVGVASVNWGSKIMPLQSLFDQGYGFSSDITAAIYYAVDMGADVINLSLGGPSPDTFTRAAVQYALENNVIVIAASGNCGLNQTDAECLGFTSPGGMSYPARYPETIAVGATTSADERASFSSWGPELDLVAPGSGSIQTTSWSVDNQTSLYSTSSFGTSFSAPIVSGSIALIRSQFPDISQNEALALIINSADKVSGMGAADWDEEYGYGRLNVSQLLSELEVYRRQLLKADGQISLQNTQTAPQINTNLGLSNASSITEQNIDNVKTYCVSTPKSICSLKLKKSGSTQTVDFGNKLTNNQGIAIFDWEEASVSSGNWQASVTSNGLTSQIETLIVE